VLTTSRISASKSALKPSEQMNVAQATLVVLDDLGAVTCRARV
jgi:hypothetical protein